MGNARYYYKMRGAINALRSGDFNGAGTTSFHDGPIHCEAALPGMPRFVDLTRVYDRV